MQYFGHIYTKISVVYLILNFNLVFWVLSGNATELVDENRSRPVVITFECAQNHLEVIKTQTSGSRPWSFGFSKSGEVPPNSNF